MGDTKNKPDNYKACSLTGQDAQPGQHRATARHRQKIAAPGHSALGFGGGGQPAITPAVSKRVSICCGVICFIHSAT